MPMSDLMLPVNRGENTNKLANQHNTEMSRAIEQQDFFQKYDLAVARQTKLCHTRKEKYGTEYQRELWRCSGVPDEGKGETETLSDEEQNDEKSHEESHEELPHATEYAKVFTCAVCDLDETS